MLNQYQIFNGYLIVHNQNNVKQNNAYKLEMSFQNYTSIIAQKNTKLTSYNNKNMHPPKKKT